jgi:hypothetical protein
MKKNLLVLAHRNEAKCLLEAYPSAQIKQVEQAYHLNEQTDLLITGEGQYNVMIKLTQYLSLFGNNLQKIINYGVAGSLHQELKQEMITPIKNSISFDGQDFRFHNFFHNNSEKKQSDITCISIDKRINDLKIKKMLSMHGQVLDRELWAINYVAKNFKLAVESYKVISDELEETDICQLVKTRAEIYANIIYKHFYDYYASQVEIDEAKIFNYPAQLYLTHSMRNKMDKLLDSLSLKLNQSKKDILVSELDKLIEQDNKNPKELALNIIGQLEKKLNPMRTKLELELEQICLDLKRSNIQCKTDREWEKCYLEISTRIHHQDQLNILINGLKNFSFEKLEQLFEGKTLAGKNDV